jgi:hypothetical protein
VAAAQTPPATAKRDLTLVLSAVGAIFAGLIGTNVLDLATSARPMLWADHAAVVLWVPALLLLALCAYKSPAEARWMRKGAWVATGLAGFVTAGVLVATGFGFSRDTDYVRLSLRPDAVQVLQTLCGGSVHAGDIDGTLRTKTLQEEFVIFDFAKKLHSGCKNSVDIPRADIRGVREDPAR